MRRVAQLVLAVGVALASFGCGASNPKPRVSTGAPRPVRAPVAIDRRAAAAEARSAASQDAVRQDFSIPPIAFHSSCRAPGGAARARTWTCTVRSTDRRCRGDVTLLVTRTGAVVTTRVRLPCRGSSSLG